MHRIDSQGATAEGRFTEGNPTIPEPATVVSADWLNAVQDEILNVLAEAGIQPEKADNAQLKEAIKSLAPKELPVGGLAGQVLTKTTESLKWEFPPKVLPEGGTAGQIITRRPDAGLAWMDMPKRIRGIRHVTYTESGTYTPASNVAIIEVRVSGAGGGAGADNQGHVKPDGEAGGDTSFIGGATSITAKGGGPGLNPLATGVIKIRSAWSGGTATGVESSYVVPAGGSLGGATNAARDAACYIRHGIDGQPGGLVVAVIAQPFSTYNVTIGAGGLSGTVMTGTEAAAGLNGSVVITEYLEE